MLFRQNIQVSGHYLAQKKYGTPILLALIAAGLAGNYFRLPLFLNVDLLFGSIFALLALQLFGVARGVFSAVIIAGYTYVLWNHPYAIVIMTAEVVMVGWLSSRHRVGLVLADVLYWLMIGMPLVYLFYHIVMHVPLSSTPIIMTKQAVNGIANALVARLIYNGYLIRYHSTKVSYNEIISSLLFFFVLIPMLFMLTISARSDFGETEHLIRQSLHQHSLEHTSRLKTWVESRTATGVYLAELAASKTPQQMQLYLEQAKRSDRNFNRVGLMDANAITTAYFPLFDELGQSTIGKSFAERPYILILKRTLKPMLSDVAMSKMGVPTPRVGMFVPVVSGGSYTGYITINLNLQQLKDHLETSTREFSTLYTLVDKNGMVIMTNRNDQAVMKPFARGVGKVIRLDGSMNQWLPELPSNVSIVEVWRKSYYIEETSIGSMGEWKLILEQPMARFQKQFYEKYSVRFGMVLLMLIFALALAEVLTRRMIATLEKLCAVTDQLPFKLSSEATELDWPKSNITETHYLIDNFMKMTDSLLMRFREIRSVNNMLEQRTAEVTAERQRLAGIIKATNVGTWEWNVQTGEVVFNERWAEILGYTLEELSPVSIETWKELAQPDDLKASYELLEKHFKGELEYYSHEVRLRHKNGHWVWVRDRGKVITWSDAGKPLIVMGTHQDITKRKLEEEIKEARFRLLQFANDHTLAELLQATLDEAEQLTDSLIGFFHFVAPDQLSISLQAWSSNTRQNMCKADVTESHYPVDHAGVWADCIRERRETVHNDYPTLPGRKGLPEGHAPVTRELVVPVMRNDMIVALLGVGNKPEDYIERDSKALLTLADFAWDIIEKKLAEVALIESESRLDQMATNNRTITWEVDALGLFSYVSHVSEAVIGYHPDELVGRMHFYDCGPESERAMFKEAADAVFKSRNSFVNFERSILTKNGQPVWVSTNGIPLLDAAGNLLGYRGSYTDITERKLKNEKLREGEEKYRAIIDAFDGFMYICSDDYRITFMNDKLIQQVGGDVTGEYCHKALYDLDAVCHWCRCKEVYSGTSVSWELQSPKDNRWYTIHCSPIYNTDGTISRQTTLIDITDAKKLKEQFAQTQKMEAIGLLAGGVAHDFNNMLTIINGFAQLGLMDCDPSIEVYNYLEQILNASDRSADITRQLLAFSRQQTTEPQVLDFNAAVSGMLKMLRRLIGEDVTLGWTPGSGLHKIKIDPAQLDQIMVNLCVNARDAIQGVGKIDIYSENIFLDAQFVANQNDITPGDYVMLTISDNGSGMGKDVIDRIFEPFYTTKELGRGTGLGLSTVFGIVKQNGGSIGVYSEPGLGTVFKIYLPAENAAAMDVKVKEQKAIGGNETILLVEDERDIMVLGVTMLSKLGYTVLSANTPEEARQLVDENSCQIDLLISDIIMPGMNGRDLSEQLLLVNPEMKCLFMSGYTAAVIAERGKIDENMCFLQKPFTFPALAGKVREALKER